MIDKISVNASYDYSSSDYSSKETGKSSATQEYEYTSGKTAAAGPRSGRTRSAHAAGRNQYEKKQESRRGLPDWLSGKEKGAVAGKNSWLESLRAIVTPVLNWIKKFWEADGSGRDSGQTLVTPEDLADLDLPPLDEVGEIPAFAYETEEAVKSHDLQKMEQALTHNGAKRLAHHSDLLTYYDRRGRLIEMDDAARHKVLFGDKSILKL